DLLAPSHRREDRARKARALRADDRSGRRIDREPRRGRILRLIPHLPPSPRSASSGSSSSGESDVGVVERRPRYEDIAQDGRVMLTGLMHGLGGSAWSAMVKKHAGAFAAFRAEGILPILRRLILVGEKGPISVDEPVRYEGTWRFAREKDG